MLPPYRQGACIADRADEPAPAVEAMTFERVCPGEHEASAHIDKCLVRAQEISCYKVGPYRISSCD